MYAFEIVLHVLNTLSLGLIPRMTVHWVTFWMWMKEIKSKVVHFFAELGMQRSGNFDRKIREKQVDQQSKFSNNDSDVCQYTVLLSIHHSTLHTYIKQRAPSA